MFGRYIHKSIIMLPSVCTYLIHPELRLMFGLMDRIPNGVDPMLTFLESYINQSGVDDMKASAEIITTVSH